MDYLENEMKYYIESEETTGALMITGKWGSGKTYSVNYFSQENSRNAMIRFVSLFGVDTPDMLRKRVKEEYISALLNAKGKKRKALKVLNDATKGVSGFVAGLSQANPAASTMAKGINSIVSWDVLTFVDVKKTIKMISRVKPDIPFVLVFDDFERCSIPIKDRIGLINDYVENIGVKTIILANTDKFNNDEWSDFNEFKEKVVSRTVNCCQDEEMVMNNIIDSYKSKVPSYCEFLKANRELFLLAFKHSEYNNFRMLKCCINDFERIYGIWHMKSGVQTSDVKEFVYEFSAREYEARSGILNVTDVYEPFMMDQSKKTGIDDVRKKYKDGTFSRDFYSVYDWLINGKWDENAFQDELLKKHVPVNESPEEKFLNNHLWDLEQTDIDAGLPAALERAYDGDLSRTDLIQLLYSANWLVKNNIVKPDAVDYGRMESGFDARMEKIKNGEITEPNNIRGVDVNTIDPQSHELYQKIQSLEDKMTAWENRRELLLFYNGNDTVDVIRLRNQFFEEFDDELRTTFTRRYLGGSNALKQELIKSLKNCEFFDKNHSDETNISTTKDNYIKLKADLKNEYNKYKNKNVIDCVVINDAINILDEKIKKASEELEKRKNSSNK